MNIKIFQFFSLLLLDTLSQHRSYIKDGRINPASVALRFRPNDFPALRLDETRLRLVSKFFSWCFIIGRNSVSLT